MMNEVFSRLMVGLGVTMVASAVMADNPYQEIAMKNAFGLKAGPAVVEEAVIEKPLPQANLALSGMARLAGEKQVFLSVTVPGEKRATYLRLGEQEREGGIEILEIDLKNEQVRIKQNGQLIMMTFMTHGIKASAPPVLIAPPPMPVMIDAKQVKP